MTYARDSGISTGHINCHTAAALEITKRECGGLQSCVLHAIVSEYGEPCWLIKKYLAVCENFCACVYLYVIVCMCKFCKEY